MPTLEDFDKYRFYQCVIKPQGYQCNTINDPKYNPLENSILISINKNIPKIGIIEKQIIKYKLSPNYIHIH